MNKDEGTSTSKRLSWLLRHGARETGIDMDAAGWVEVDEVRRRLGMSRAAIESAVAENTKSRLELRGTRIRACQGHSLDGVPVTREALEASWEEHLGATREGPRLRALFGFQEPAGMAT